MKKIYFVLMVAALSVGILAVTKDRWFPADFSREWHRRWLAGRRGTESPEDRILARHREEMRHLELEYQEKIDREKKLYEIYRIEYERLLQERASR